MGRYIYNILLSIDQFLNTLFGGNPDMTISERSRIARGKGRLWGKAVCSVLDKIDPGHCDDSKDEEIP